MAQHHKTFDAYLEQQGSRYTTQKRTIVDEIFRMRGHFEVEDFLEKLRKKGDRQSRATVYRTIKQLLDANLLQKISAPDGRVLYEKSSEEKHHDHLICNSCGRIFEIKDDAISKYLAKNCEDIGFTPEYRSLHIYGRCKKCSK